jgi:hypothetical protein
METAAVRSPQDPVVHYNLARLVGGEPPRFPPDVAWAIDHLDRGLAIQPIAGLQILKAASLAGWRGDLQGARAALDELDKRPLADRAESRAVSKSMWIGLLERNPDRVIAAGALTAKAFFDDAGGIVQSKDWLLALAHRLAGKEAQASIDLQNAETILRQRLSEVTGRLRQDALVDVAQTLALQGRTDDAIAMLAPV